jgi:hypothetical protein
MRRATLVAASLIAVSPAEAAQCPYGQIFRVHLDECVGAQSALARAYVQPLHRRNIPAAKIFTIRHVADADAPPYPLPPSAPEPPPAQADDQATLVLPDLEDGMPAIWRLCQAAPNLCKPNDR